MAVMRRDLVTSNIDEAVEIFTQAYSGGGLRLSDTRDDFQYTQELVGAPGVAAVRQGFTASLAAKSDPSATLFLSWTEHGGTSYRMGGREVATENGMLWSGRRLVEASVEHAQIESIQLDRGDFETRARLLLDRPEFVLPDFAALPSAEHVGAARRHLSLLRGHLLDDVTIGNPLVSRAAIDLTIAVVLAATGLDEAADGRTRIPSALRRAMTFIDENLDRPIALADIAGAAGLSARGLHTAFQRLLGESPMQRVRRGRLAHVHEDLLAADPEAATVAAIARRWGFTHLGRFAQTYRQAFGEPPSTTLRR